MAIGTQSYLPQQTVISTQTGISDLLNSLMPLIMLMMVMLMMVPMMKSMGEAFKA